MLLQNLDLNSDSNMSMYSSADEFDSKKHFSETDSKTKTDLSVSPFSYGVFSNNNATNNRTIPALPNLTAPSSSTSWSSSSGTYSLFSTSISSSSFHDKNNNVPSDSNPFHFNATTNVKPQSHNRSINLLPSNKSYHTGPNPSNLDMQNTGMAMQRSTDPLESVLGPFPCLRIRGLPFDASIEDVLVIFSGFLILDVVVLPTSSFNQNNSGAEAFVVFGNPLDVQMALQRGRMGPQYLEFYQGKRADYYAAVSSVSQYNLHLRDETGNREDSQLNSVQGSTWSASGVHHATSNNQVLRNPIMQESIMNSGVKSSGGTNHHHGYSKGGIPSTGSRGGRGSGDSIRPKSSGRGSGRGGGIQVGEHTGYLRMRGLPFTVTKGEIFDFFERYKPIQESICLTYRSDGRVTGEGYIAFTNPDDAKDAMALHRNTMGNRYIELFISNKEEHGRAFSRETVLEQR